MKLGLTAKMIGAAIVVIAMLTVRLVGIGNATTIVNLADPSTYDPPRVFGNLGAAVIINSDLTLKARFGIDDAEGNPAVLVTSTGNSFTGGSAGTVFVGALGDLNAQNPADCVGGGGMMNPVNCGVGVQDDGAGGSRGISGEGGNQDESLIFDFAAPGILVDSIVLELIGLNDLNCLPNCPKNNDVVSLQIDFFDSLTDTVIGSVNAFIDPSDDSEGGPSQRTLTFSDITATLLFGNEVDMFAVRAVEGHFGVTGISYDVVPEPSLLLLLGSGLAGLGLLRRKRKGVGGSKTRV